MILGTVAYLSPEQVEHRVRRTPAATSTPPACWPTSCSPARAPFTGDTAISVAYRHVHDDVPAPSTRVGGSRPSSTTSSSGPPAATRPPARPTPPRSWPRCAGWPSGPASPRARRPCRRPGPTPRARRRPQPAVDPQRVPAPGRAGRGSLPGPESAWAAVAAPRPAQRPRPRPAAQPAAVRRRGRRRGGARAAGGRVGLVAGRRAVDDRPAVVGLERAAAERLLTAAAWSRPSPSPTTTPWPRGMVAAVDPAAGRRLRRGSTVRLTVSSGRPVVPAVAAGTAVAAAEQAGPGRRARRRRGSTRQEYSATVPAGAVTRTDPPPAPPCRRRHAVTLVVSRGAEPRRQVRVPFLIGRRTADATALLDRARPRGRASSRGRSRSARTTTRPRRPADHGAGSLVDPGTTITLRTL